MINRDCQLFNNIVEDKGQRIDFEKDSMDELFGMQPCEVEEHFEKKGEKVTAEKEDFSQKGQVMPDTPLRTVEATTQEVYLDINDLVIWLLIEAEKTSTEAERKVYKKVALKITEMRKKGHNKSSLNS